MFPENQKSSFSYENKTFLSWIKAHADTVDLRNPPAAFRLIDLKWKQTLLSPLRWHFLFASAHAACLRTCACARALDAFTPPLLRRDCLSRSRDRGPIVQSVALRKPIQQRNQIRGAARGVTTKIFASVEETGGVSVAWKRKRCLLRIVFCFLFFFFFCRCDCCQRASGGGTDRGSWPRLVPLELLSVVFWLTSTKEAFAQIRRQTNKQVETCPLGREWNVHMYEPGGDSRIVEFHKWCYMSWFGCQHTERSHSVVSGSGRRVARGCIFMSLDVLTLVIQHELIGEKLGKKV